MEPSMELTQESHGSLTLALWELIVKYIKEPKCGAYHGANNSDSLYLKMGL
jgi:hypothetical protein